MPNGIKNSDLVDLAQTTLENLPNMEFETVLDRQEYQAINNWFQKDKVQEESGTEISRRIMLDVSGNAAHVRLFEKDDANVGTNLFTFKAPWVQIKGQYLIERREMLRNRKPAMLVKLLELRRLDAMLSMANVLENRAWLAPESSTDDVNPRGLPYYLSKLIPAAGSGYDSTIDKPGDFSGRRVIFNDGTTSTSDKSGISPTTQAKWRNYADTITGIDGYAIKRLARAFYATNFVAPITVSDLKKGPASKFRIYVGLDDLVEYDDLARKSNDNLGADLAKFHGVSAFNRVPVLHAPALNSDADKPIYGVNHNQFYPIVLSGDWMRENEPIIPAFMHNVMITYVDGSYQYFCKNVREAGFVLHRERSA